jgi:hypothetical protein
LLVVVLVDLGMPVVVVAVQEDIEHLLELLVVGVLLSRHFLCKLLPSTPLQLVLEGPLFPQATTTLLEIMVQILCFPQSPQRVAVAVLVVI